MKIKTQISIRIYLIIMCIICYLWGIHTWGRHLDSSTEVHIVVAQMICCCLNFIFVKRCRVVRYFEVNWESCANISFVRYQEEIEKSSTFIFYKSSIENSPRTRVKILALSLLIKSVRNSLVCEDIENSGIVALSIALNGINNEGNFFFNDLWFHCGTPTAISVHDNLLRQVSIVFILVDF